MPALIIKPGLILVRHTDDLGWYIMSNQQEQLFVQNLNRIVSMPNVMPGQILYCTTDCIPVDLMFQENFPTNTQSLVPPEPSKQLPTERSDLSYLLIGATIATCTRSGTSVLRRSSVPPRAWVGPTPNLSQPETVAKSKSCNSMTVHGGRTQTLLMMPIQITHRQERGTNILCLHDSH